MHSVTYMLAVKNSAHTTHIYCVMGGMNFTCSDDLYSACLNLPGFTCMAPPTGMD